MDDLSLVEVLFHASRAAREALDGLDDWGPNGERPGQYRLDVAADNAAVAVLSEAGLSVLSEESGRTEAALPLLAVLDPIDGSTNAHRGIAAYSTSICVFDELGPRVGTVVNHLTGTRYHAIRTVGAWRDGEVLSPSRCQNLERAIISLSGLVPGLAAWQYRTLGCASLELCAVAEGSLDGFLLGRGITLQPWDYLAGLLLCAEAGAATAELDGQDPWVAESVPRRPAAASTQDLLTSLLSASRR
ncbi:MAG TPA: inositol monophosphatase family protein [Acidimicrobiales bacterium]|nr:inositol monophosphatase family protein [Acidimicrobiales bacterium]